MRGPAQGVTGGWVMLDLVLSGFLCVTFLKQRNFHKLFVIVQMRLKQISKNEKPKINPRQMAVTKSGK